MPYEIHVKGASSPAENAAIVTAFNNFITALRAAVSHKIDSGGTVIDGKKYSTDEAAPHGGRFGEQW